MSKDCRILSVMPDGATGGHAAGNLSACYPTLARPAYRPRSSGKIVATPPAESGSYISAWSVSPGRRVPLRHAITYQGIEVDTMWNRRWIFVAGLVICGGFVAQFAAPLSAQQKGATTPSDKKDDKKDDAQEKAKEKDLDLRLCQGLREVMEATLDKYRETNRKLPNTIRPSVIQAIDEAWRGRRSVKLVDDDESERRRDLRLGGPSRAARTQESLLRRRPRTYSSRARSAPKRSNALKAGSSWPRSTSRSRSTWARKRHCRTSGTSWSNCEKSSPSCGCTSPCCAIANYRVAAAARIAVDQRPGWRHHDQHPTQNSNSF